MYLETLSSEMEPTGGVVIISTQFKTAFHVRRVVLHTLEQLVQQNIIPYLLPVGLDAELIKQHFRMKTRNLFTGVFAAVIV